VVKQIPSGERPERRGVRSVDRALDLLLAFSATRPRLHLRDLAQAVGLPKPSTHRIATTLLERGFLRQEPDGSYSLGSRLLELGGLVSSTAALAQLTRDAVTELSAQTGETILVAEVDWTDYTVLIIQKRDATHPLAVTSPVGKRSGLGNGCIGKAILGAMDPVAAGELIPRLHLVRRTEHSVVDREQFAREIEQVRKQGWASETNEFITGVAGVAAAVCLGGRPLGAVAIIAPVSRSPQERLDELGQLLLRTLTASPGTLSSLSNS